MHEATLSGGTRATKAQTNATNNKSLSKHNDLDNPQDPKIDASGPVLSKLQDSCCPEIKQEFISSFLSKQEKNIPAIIAMQENGLAEEFFFEIQLV